MGKTRLYSRKINRFCYSINGKYYSDKACRKEISKNSIQSLDWGDAEKSLGETECGGEEIFEGDIIHDLHYVGHAKRQHYYEVVMKEGKFHMINISSGRLVNLDGFLFTSEKIIGNINQNPELL